MGKNINTDPLKVEENNKYLYELMANTIWITYRKNFPPLLQNYKNYNEKNYISDTGWGYKNIFSFFFKVVCSELGKWSSPRAFADTFKKINWKKKKIWKKLFQLLLILTIILRKFLIIPFKKSVKLHMISFQTKRRSRGSGLPRTEFVMF